MTQEQEKLPPIRYKYVDSREPEVIRLKLVEYGWEQKRLLSGDFMFATHDFRKVGVTRKRVEDLLNSIGDRLSGQLEEMMEFFDIKIIVLEGSWRTLNPREPGSKMITTRGVEYHTWSSVWNYLRRWQDKGFTIELTVDEGHTIQRLNEIFALYQKEYSLSARSKDFVDDRVMAFPSGTRGETAMNVLNMVGSLEQVCRMSIADLRLVPGIGQKKAELIWNHFHKGTEELLRKQSQEKEDSVNVVVRKPIDFSVAFEGDTQKEEEGTQQRML